MPQRYWLDVKQALYWAIILGGNHTICIFTEKFAAMKVLKVLGITLLVILLIGLIAALILPKEMNVSISVDIDAPVDQVWTNVSSMQAQDAWSPWYDVDPDMKVSFDGEAGAVGSSFTWSGNDQVQEGTQTITAVDAENHSMTTKVVHNWGEGEGSITVRSNDSGGTTVEQTYVEHVGMFGSLFMFISNGEKMMEDLLSNGLSKLKTLAEENAAKMAAKPAYEIQEETRGARKYAGKKEVIKMADMGAYFAENMPKIAQACGATMAGPPSALYYTWDEENGQSELTVAIPVNSEKAPNDYELYDLPEGRYLVIDYYGSYDNVGGAHEALGAYMEENNLTWNGPALEEYITDPGQEPDTSKWLTKIVYPVISKEKETEE